MMSTPLTNAGGPSAAPRAGADLRAARERLGWPIGAVSAALRIRLPHLEALEEGRIDLLPGNAYAVGFLRTYARALGLDPDEIARRFKAEAREVNRRTELMFPAPMPQRGVPAGAVILLGRRAGDRRLCRLVPAVRRGADCPPETCPRCPNASRHPGRASRTAAAEPAAAAERPLLVRERRPPAAPAALARPAPPSRHAAGARRAYRQVRRRRRLPTPPAAVPHGAGASGGASQVVAGADRSRIGAGHRGRLAAGAGPHRRQRVAERVLHSGEIWPVPRRADLVLTPAMPAAPEWWLTGSDPGAGAPAAPCRRDLPLGSRADQGRQASWYRSAPLAAAHRSGAARQRRIAAGRSTVRVARAQTPF